MKMFEDYLEVFDRYFSSKKESEKWLVIIATAMIIIYIGYTLFLPYAKERYEISKRKTYDIQKSINHYTIYLQSITENGDRNFRLNKLNEDITKKNKTIHRLTKNIDFIDSKMVKLSNIVFNKKSWANFLNTITHKAKIHHLNLKYMDNVYVENNSTFGHVLEVGISLVGNYKDIVQFMSELEQDVLITDIVETKFIVDENTSALKSDINLSVWGINYS